MNKLLSVVIPTYNRQAKTVEAINSVYSLFPELVEIIVIDDASLAPFACSSVNCNNVDVRVVRVESNGGAGLSRKIGVSHAKANTVAFLDSDDCYSSTWIDDVLKLINNNSSHHFIIVGSVIGGSIIHAMVFKLLMATPTSLQLIFTRVITIFFNPFYTPSLVINKEDCSFHDSLRYCEDYYTFSSAIFKADKIYILQDNACTIGREPNTTGGLSNSNQEMFAGELTVRKSMLFMSVVPIRYRVIVPFGFLYQYMRRLIKSILMRVK